MKTLFTIGYEGRSQDGFIAVLVENRVSKVLDSRALAFSFKKGFSKTPLRNALEQAGIGYVHAPQVGAPKPLRAALKDTGDYPAFFEAYHEHLRGLNGGFSAVVEEASAGNVCVLCFERDHDKCHRSVLAQRIRGSSATALRVEHL